MKNQVLLIICLCITLSLNATVIKTVTINAGGLSSALSSTDLATVNNLTISGTINTIDFLTIRDDMPALHVIDLSGATIETYTGTLGTGGTDSIIVYPANAVPVDAFYNPNTYTGKGSLNSVILPSSVTIIGDNAFNGCTGLSGPFTLPPSVTSIGKDAYSWCNNLTGSLTIPSTVTSIGNSAFYRCEGLFSVNILANITSIANGTFAYCTNLMTVSIPSSVTIIKSGAFGGCDNLLFMNIPSSVTIIEDDAFESCFDLISVIIPSSVSSIGGFAFAGCPNLTEITIPSSVTSIGSGVFEDCSGLTAIYSYTTTPVDLSLSNDVFAGVMKSSCILYVPQGTKTAYQTANQWKDFTNIVEMTNTGVSTQTIDPVIFYPNPVTDGFFIKGLNGNGILTLLDISGKTLLTKHVSGNEYISLSTFFKGLYIVKITTTEGTIEKEVLKE